ncbi:MAG: hypothetical protein ACXW3Q_01850 [Rhodoplanes sp.]
MTMRPTSVPVTGGNPTGVPVTGPNPTSIPQTPHSPVPKPRDPDEGPVPGPAGPRTPYAVNDPGIADPDNQPGADPDYIASTPPGPGQM